MKNLALIYFVDDKDKHHRNSENVAANIFLIFFKRMSLSGLFRKIKRAFIIRTVIDKKIEVDSNLVIQGVKLPYTLSELNKSGKMTINRINRAILKICTENSIDRCIIPAQSDCSFESCEKNRLKGKIIYTVLAENILNDICARQGLGIRNVDIAVIQGDDDVLPYMFIKLLSPVVKFITLVTNYRELMEKKIEEVCDETGLSVRITNDVESVLKICDFVINYRNIKSSGIKSIVNSNAIVINYGELEETLPGLKNKVVNGIEIGLGNKYLQGFKKEIFDFYSPIEIAEIVLVNKSDISINNLCDLADYVIVDNLKKHFNEEGFFVRGYL